MDIVYGGSLLKVQKLLVGGEHLSAIGAMTMNSVLNVKIVRGSVNADVFYDYIQTSILPNLLPFNGINPNSIVILDNSAIHHAVETVSMIEETGALVHFLPPYSPDIMPIEELFSKVKVIMKSMKPENQI